MTATYVPLIPAYGMLSDLGDTIGSQNAAQEAAAKELWQRATANAILSGQEPPPMPAPRQGMLQRLMGAINPTAAPQAPQQPATVAGQPQVSTPIADPSQGGKSPFGVPDTLWRAQIGQESGGNQFGDNGQPLTSPKGATGIAQVMPGTAPEAAQLAGVSFDPQRYKTDSAYNEMLGRAYMGAQMQKFGDPVKALAAYNAGPQRVADAIERHGEGWLRHMPAETQDYVARITQRAQPTQVAGPAMSVGGGQTAAAPQNDAMRAWPKALQTLPGIMLAMQTPLKPIAEKALEAYNKANAARPNVLSPEEARAKYNAPADFKGIIYEDEKGTPHIQKFGPDAQTTVNLSGEKSYDQTVGKGYGETMLEIQKAGRAAQNSVTSLKLMEKAIDTPGFYSGSSSDAVLAARKVAVSLGIADAASAAPNELFTKISNKLVLDLAGGSLGTGFSNADRDYLASSVPNLANTPEGNKQIIQIMKKVEGRRAEVAKFARDYAKFHGGRLDAEFDDELAKWSDENKLFPDAEKGASVQKAAPKLGSVPIPPDRARALRQHPDLRDAFDQTYGKGAADQILGVTNGPQL
ncbi:MAG: transglycosylase SLT domain-containing protein [Candidatus Hydrogenedentales bacterium]|jgi:soluble lytic murein transglycosylase-like protein